jgi:hypothetical protein
MLKWLFARKLRRTVESDMVDAPSEEGTSGQVTDEDDRLVAIIANNPAFLAELIAGSSNNERLMILVAYTVVQPHFISLNSLHFAHNRPFSIDDFINAAKQEYKKQDGDVVNSRRMWWCLIAACILKLTRTNNPDLEAGGMIWRHLILSMEVAQGALTNNMLWSEYEKKPFLRPTHSAMQVIANIYIPKNFRYTDAIEKLRAESGIIILRN